MSEEERGVAQDILDDKQQKKFHALLAEYRVIKLKEEAINDRKNHVKERLQEFILDTGYSSIDAEEGVVYLKAESTRQTFDKKKAVTMLSKHGIPVSELDGCYRESKIKPSLVVKLKEDA